MMHRRVLPRGARLDQGNKQMFNTLAGAMASNGRATIRGMRLPAFDKNRIIDQHEFEVFDADCRYDVILGGDFLAKIGMNLKYDDLVIEWYGNTIPMETLSSPDLTAAQVEQYLSQMDEDELLNMGIDPMDSYLAAPIRCQV